LFFVPQLAATIISGSGACSFSCFFLDVLVECAFTHTHQEHQRKKQEKEQATLVLFLASTYIYIVLLYPHILS